MLKNWLKQRKRIKELEAQVQEAMTNRLLPPANTVYTSVGSYQIEILEGSCTIRTQDNGIMKLDAGSTLTVQFTLNNA